MRLRRDDAPPARSLAVAETAALDELLVELERLQTQRDVLLLLAQLFDEAQRAMFALFLDLQALFVLALETFEELVLKFTSGNQFVHV